MRVLVNNSQIGTAFYILSVAAFLEIATSLIYTFIGFFIRILEAKICLDVVITDFKSCPKA